MTADAAERVVVQWAHLSKYEDDAGYHVLGCSNGSLNSEHFDNQLVRYSPGTLQPDELPQVIISWCRRRPSEDKTKEEKYVAMAIYHPFQAVRDISDRRVMPTDYFCAPYQSLASTEVPYLSMYKAFGEFRIPVDPAKPILLDMPSAPPTVLTHSGEILLAQRAAALLLTEKPVCILGAGSRCWTGCGSSTRSRRSCLTACGASSRPPPGPAAFTGSTRCASFSPMTTAEATTTS